MLTNSFKARAMAKVQNYAANAQTRSVMLAAEKQKKKPAAKRSQGGGGGGSSSSSGSGGSSSSDGTDENLAVIRRLELLRLGDDGVVAAYLRNAEEVKGLAKLIRRLSFTTEAAQPSVNSSIIQRDSPCRQTKQRTMTKMNSTKN
jgi:hypothetical protein